MRRKDLEKTTLSKLFSRKDCAGWAWRAADKNHRYMWQNSNDLGLLGEELDVKVSVTQKVKVAPKEYLYVVSYGYACESDGNDNTLRQLKAIMRDIWNLPLQERDEKILGKLSY